VLCKCNYAYYAIYYTVNLSILLHVQKILNYYIVQQQTVTVLFWQRHHSYRPTYLTNAILYLMNNNCSAHSSRRWLLPSGPMDICC